MAKVKDETIGTNKQKGKKVCTCCHKERNLTDYYISYSPLYSIDKRVPICKECCKTLALNEDGSINEVKLNELLRNIDRPYYKDLIFVSEQSVKRENGYLSDEEVKYHGREILQAYFRQIATRQDRARSYSDSERDNFIHDRSNRPVSEKNKISKEYTDIKTELSLMNASNVPNDTLIYDDKWMGKYTQKDLDYLNKYYSGLERDYKIITENHRDYARKIAKASLQMDKAFDDMINGIEGADAKYKNAREAFDTLSKSAKFSESTRSVNDVGISSFSKVAAMVEAHNWIPEHKPLEKDTIDELIDYLSTITKSL